MLQPIEIEKDTTVCPCGGSWESTSTCKRGSVSAGESWSILRLKREQGSCLGESTWDTHRGHTLWTETRRSQTNKRHWAAKPDTSRKCWDFMFRVCEFVFGLIKNVKTQMVCLWLLWWEPRGMVNCHSPLVGSIYNLHGDNPIQEVEAQLFSAPTRQS